MDNKILIEPLINKKLHGYAIQGKIFSFALRVTNVSEGPSQEIEISSITLHSGEGQAFQEDFGEKKFFIKKLNPEESYVITIDDFGHFMYGLVRINLIAQPPVSQVVLESNPQTPLLSYIEFFQKNPFTKKCQKIGKNEWTDFFYVKSRKEYGQEIANKLMGGLTVLIVIFAAIAAFPVIRELIIILSKK